MVAKRQDAWSEDDDLLLAEVVLRHIREGSTQLNAFEEVGYRLGRTPAACGFRWNSLVRKKYESAIQIAKAQRQQRKTRGKSRFQPEDMHFETDYTEAFSIKQESDPQPEYTNGSMKKITYEAKSKQDQELELSFDHVIKFLRQQKDNVKRLKQLEKDVQEKETELQKLRAENQRMEKDLGSVQSDYQTINDDYKALIQIMDRARKLAVLGEEQDDKVSFKMDKNGNLERVEKS